MGSKASAMEVPVSVSLDKAQPTYYEWQISHIQWENFTSTESAETPDFDLGGFTGLKMRFWPNFDVVNGKCSIRVDSPVQCDASFLLYLGDESQKLTMTHQGNSSYSIKFFDAVPSGEAYSSIWL